MAAGQNTGKLKNLRKLKRLLKLVPEDRRTVAEKLITELAFMEGKLWAYYRQLSGKEFFAAATVNATEDVLFTVNHRADIDTDMLVEYAGKYYQITRIDNHEGYKTDLDLYCKSNPDQTPDIKEE